MVYHVGEMYVRVQRVRRGSLVYEYVHVVQGYRDQDGKVRHRVVANLGRRDHLKESGALDNLAGAFARLDPIPGRYLVGALPIVVPILRRLDVVGIVDRACPMRGRSRLTHGEVICALVANRLTDPRPLYDVQGWARTYEASAWLGTPAVLLNDDRLGRALDVLADRLDEVSGALGLQAVSTFGVDAARLHWDFTSVAFCGRYDDQDPEGPQVAFGHSSDRQSHRRQLKVAQAVTATGVPVFHRVVSGARHEGAETATLLETLRGLAAPRRLLLVADSALVTTKNLAAANAAGIKFLARLPRSFGYEEQALLIPAAKFQRLRYRSERTRKPGSHTCTFDGAEGSIAIRPPEGDLTLRVLYVIGSEERAAARASRAKLLSRAEQALARIERGLRTRRRQDREAIERRVAKAVSAGKVGRFLRTAVTFDNQQPVLSWHRDEKAIVDAERRDGLYALVSNLGPRQASPHRLLRLFKDQAIVERTHHFLKGPLVVRPVFLHSNRRAAALISVCSVAVMVYGLVEAQIRSAIAPARNIPGLLPEGRPARPTASNVFAAFEGLGFHRARTAGGLEEIPDPLTTSQCEILRALGVPSILPGGQQVAMAQCGKWG